MVTEIRQAQLDLAARAKFASDGDRITETRGVIDGLFVDDTDELTERRAARSAEDLQAAGDYGWVEVG